MLSGLLQVAGNIFQWFLKRNSPEERKRRKKDEIRKKHEKDVAAIEAAIASKDAEDINRITTDITSDFDVNSGELPKKPQDNLR